MQRHILGHLIQPPGGGRGPHFPFLCLTVSGGHTQIVNVTAPLHFELLAETQDDAVGEAFDKAAKILGLPYPGGPQVEQAAKGGNPKAHDLPRPLVTGHNVRRTADFSFSGLKTVVRQLAEKNVDTADVSASFQAAVIDILTDRTRIAMQRFRADFPGGNVLVVAGGVAANQAIGAALERLCGQCGFVTRIPPPRLCTDNAAMIAWAGVERMAAGERDEMGISPRARWPLSSKS